MRPESEPWWRQAGADLQAARINFDAGQHYAASWFGQQSVEKGLKALYIELHAVLAPRTHDLEFLGREVRVPPAIATDLLLLNPTFDMVRYPDPAVGIAPVDGVSEGDAAVHLAAAERVMMWIAQQLRP